MTLENDRELLKGNTPMLILSVLKDVPLHGYGIAREIEKRSDNALKFKEGTLYPALHTLERDGMILGEWVRGEGGRPKKIYSVTPQGMTVLSARRDHWKAFSTAIERVLEGESNAETQSAGNIVPALNNAS